MGEEYAVHIYNDEEVEQVAPLSTIDRGVLQIVSNYAPLFAIGTGGCILISLAALIVVALIPLYLPTRQINLHQSTSIPYVVSYGTQTSSTTDLTASDTQSLSNQLMNQVGLDNINIKYAQLSSSTSKNKRQTNSENSDQCGTGPRFIISFTINNQPGCDSDRCKNNFKNRVNNYFAVLHNKPTLSVTFMNGETRNMVLTYCSMEQIESNYPSTQTTTPIITTQQTTLTTTNIILNTPPRRIDTHIHFIPAIYNTTLVAAGGDPAGGPSPAWSIEQTLQRMSQMGVETAVISISTPGTRIYDNDQAKGRTFARQLNQYAADLTRNYSQQIRFFATLPPFTDVQGVLNEINYTETTFKPSGYVVYSSYRNFTYIGNTLFQPIWAKLNELKAVVFLHPSAPSSTVLDRYFPPAIADFPHETTRAAADFVVTGTRAMFPDVKIILAHAGGTLPYLAERLSIVGAVPTLGTPRNQQQMLQDFRSFYFDTTLSSSTPQLLALLEFADPTKILFGSDDPYVPFPIGLNITNNLDKFFLQNRYNQSEQLWQAINNGNAKLMFGDRI